MNGTNDTVEKFDVSEEHNSRSKVSYGQQHSRAGLLEVDPEVTRKPDGKNVRKGKKKVAIVIISIILLLAVGSLVLAAAITLSILLTGDSDSASSSSGSMDVETVGVVDRMGVCRTSGCKTLAELLKSNLNETVDPCDDFYTFACGSWLNRTSSYLPPPGEISFSQPNVYGRKSKLELRPILESKSTNETIEAVRKVKEFYKLCMDTDEINRMGAAPLLALVEKTGGWNLIDGGIAGEWSINSTHFIQSHLYRSRAFFEFDVRIDKKNSSEFIITITRGSRLPHPSSFSPYFKKVMSLLNSTVTEEIYQEVADELIALEMKLNAISVWSPARYRLGDLPSLWPDFDWVNSFQHLFSQHNVTIDENETVIVEMPTYFQNLSSIFRNTSTDTLENYAKWSLVSFYIEYLSDLFIDAINVYLRKTPKRFQTCLTLLRNAFPIAIARQYIEEIYPKASREKVSDMVDRLIEAFRKRIKESEWLNDATEQASLTKLNNIGKKIAYPDLLFNNTYLNGLLSDIEIYESFMHTVAETRRALLIRRLKRLHQVVNREFWNFSPIDSNAFYIPPLNEITIPAVFILPPNFGIDWPDYYNYGALGTIIGHELTHGFDNRGQKYDPYGNVREWWSKAAVESFEKRQSCIIEQYSNYEFHGQHITSKLTLGEDIADNGGLQTSYQAYKTLVSADETQQLTLPGLSYTPEQIFFIAQAQTLCTQYRSQKISWILHSPAKYRVIGPMSNSDAFSRVFMCSPGTPLNPPNKCIVW